MKYRTSRTRPAPRTYRPLLERLEARDVPAAPVIDPLTTVAPFIPAGKSVFIPITASDPQNEPLSFSVTSSNAAVTASVEPASNPFLQINVAGFGTMTFELFGDLAPDTVGRLSGLIQSGFYNGLTFHRVASGFVIQGGDPLGNGTGGPGFTFSDEFNPAAIFSGKGELAMANSGRDTNGSQFFVTVGSPRSLDFIHNIWGQLVRGFDVLQAINSVPTNPPGDGQPTTPVVITNMSLIQDNHDAVLLLKNTAAAGASSTITVTAQNSGGEVSAPMTFSATVVADTQNDPAFLNPVSNQATAVDTPITFTVGGTDLENDALTFTATILNPDPRVTVKVVGNQVTVTPTGGFTGPVDLQIGVSENGQAKPDTQDIVVAVGSRQLTNATGTPFSATEGQLLNDVILGTFTDTAAGAASADYTVTINWGDRTVTTGSINKAAGGVFTVFGTNTYAQAGKYPVNVTVTLNSALGGNVATFATTATVAEAPLTSQGVGVTSTVGQTITDQIVATVMDQNPNPILANFSAVIDWGDGSTPTPGILQRAADGTIQVLGSHTYTSPGAFTITTTVRDSNSAGQVPDAVTTATASASITAPFVMPLAQGYVAGLYRTVLSREALPSEINFWNQAIANGLSDFQVAYFVEISPEHRLLQINEMYNTLLGRAPTLQEELDALNQFEAGGTAKQLQAHLMATNEYFQNRASGDLATLLQVASIDIFGTLLPQAKQNYYSWVFSTAGAFNRENAMLSLLNSREALLVEAQTDYKDTLGRAIDTGGAIQSVNLLAGGVSDEALRALLLSSDEGIAHLSKPAQIVSVTG